MRHPSPWCGSGSWWRGGGGVACSVRGFVLNANLGITKRHAHGFSFSWQHGLVRSALHPAAVHAPSLVPLCVVRRIPRHHTARIIFSESGLGWGVEVSSAQLPLARSLALQCSTCRHTGACFSARSLTRSPLARPLSACSLARSPLVRSLSDCHAPAHWWHCASRSVANRPLAR